MAMTEQEWLICTSRRAMVAFLRESGRTHERKMRLFAVACCRGIWRLLRDIVVAEKFAEGQVGEVALRNAETAANEVWNEAGFEGHEFNDAETDASEAACAAAAYPEATSAASHSAITTLPKENHAVDKAAHANILCDILGPRPFRPVTLNPAWQTSNVTARAQSIYDNRAFDCLPIVADALEDAGWWT
jgi:hypothetical protein